MNKIRYPHPIFELNIILNVLALNWPKFMVGLKLAKIYFDIYNRDNRNKRKSYFDKKVI